MFLQEAGTSDDCRILPEFSLQVTVVSVSPVEIQFRGYSKVYAVPASFRTQSEIHSVSGIEFCGLRVPFTPVSPEGSFPLLEMLCSLIAYIVVVRMLGVQLSFQVEKSVFITYCIVYSSFFGSACAVSDITGQPFPVLSGFTVFVGVVGCSIK